MPSPSAAMRRVSVLLIEEQRSDRILIEGLIADAGGDIRVHWAPSLASAERELVLHRPDCVLLDLNVHGSTGIEALDRIAAHDSTLPVVVLTSRHDRHHAIRAVAAGAQDYLVKGDVEPDTLHRSVLYAIERKRAELTAVALYTSRLRAQENARLERALLPSPLLADDPGVDIVTAYRPNRANAWLGGDFYDVVQTTDGTVHIMVGDVAGHGPDEAALGSALRVAWRALTFAGLRGNDRMRRMEQVLHAERPGTHSFATVLSVALRPDGGYTAVRAGHPGMLLHGPGTVEWLEPPPGPALGLGGQNWPQNELRLPDGHGVLLLTDGLFEGRCGPGNQRLGEEGLLDLARSLAALPGERFVTALIDAAEQRATPFGGIDDDIAVLRVQRSVQPTTANPGSASSYRSPSAGW